MKLKVAGFSLGGLVLFAGLLYVAYRFYQKHRHGKAVDPALVPAP